MNEINSLQECNDPQAIIDFDQSKKLIIINDQTNGNLLDKNSSDFWDSLYCPTYKKIKDNVYSFDWTNQANFQEFLDRLNWFKITWLLTDNLNNFLKIKSQDAFTTRRELALNIKNNIDWQHSQDFLDFEATINHEINPNIRLKDKQLQNAYHHYKLQSSMDFSVPGTGKTYIGYALFIFLLSQWKKERLVDKLVVIGPLNCFKAWKDEAKTIFHTKYNFSIFDASALSTNEKISNIIGKNYTIYLFNYEYFNTKEKIELLTNHLINEKTLVIFDEVHRIKGIKGVRARNIIDMIVNAKHPPIYKLALTGTPLPNSYEDLTNYLKILYPVELQNELGSLNQVFLKEADNDLYKAKKIQTLLYPLFMRINKNDLHVPLPNPDDIKTLAIDLSDSELMLFGKIYKLCPNPFLRFVRLIQASSNPKLLLKELNEQEIEDISEETTDNSLILPSIPSALNLDEKDKELINSINLASKTKKAIELIKQKVNEHKPVIVWCLFIDTIDLIANELGKLGIKAVTICGRDSVVERDNKIEAFKQHQYDVLITNPNTLAESVSLHKICHDAMYLEYGFNLTYLLQSKDRIHRVGLLPTDETNYYFAISKNAKVCSPIDEYIYKRLGDKAARMKEAIDSKNLILPQRTSQSDDIKAIITQVR